MNSEIAIENAILAYPGALGFPGAPAIRRVRVSPDSGVVDLMLLPDDGAKLVLIEVKDERNREALSKVVGQLLMYYGGALQLGQHGLSRLREYATEKAGQARSNEKISLVKLAGTRPTDAAWAVLERGRKLRPKDVRLFIALNCDPSPGLLHTLTAVREHHGLRIDVVVLGSRGLRVADF